MNTILGDIDLDGVSGGLRIDRIDDNYSGCTINGNYGTYTTDACNNAAMQEQIANIVQNVRNIVYGPGK